MNIVDFVEELLARLATVPQVEHVDLRSEGPTVSGRAFIRADSFLSFYFNQVTGTEAFALVKNANRLWGIDYDNIRGWHVHPLEVPEQHRVVEPKSISEIVEEFAQVLDRIKD